MDSNIRIFNTVNRVSWIRVLLTNEGIMDIQGLELIDCDACGASGFLYEMEYCECGSLVHKDCINADKCDACQRSTLVVDFLDSLVA